ncbi:MAG: FAD:protein FMN transferase [Halanaerobiales bacterium]|nr:FAD:protein FMN transferase [Halanaerobiales bacterium]
MKRRIFIVFVLIIALFLSACGNETSEDDQFDVRDSFIMGTIVTVKVYGSNRKNVAVMVLQELKRIENLMSVNIKDSEVSLINANAGVKPVKVSLDTFLVIKRAVEYSEKTEGLFDPSIGPLVQLWGIGKSDEKVPDQAELEKVLPLVNYKNIILDEKESTVYLTKSGMMIDVGGIAKGYAADKAIEIYKDNKVKSAFINIGGNVMVHGIKPDKTLWKIGIQDPRAIRDELMGVISLGDQAVVTSGDYERYFIEDGVRYHHILNPKTGQPARTGLMSVSLIGKSSFDADALSTSIYLLGREKGLVLAEKMGYEVIIVDSDKNVTISDGIKDRFKITNLNYKEISQ